MVIAFFERLEDKPRPFEQVGANLCSDNVRVLVEQNLNVFAKAGGIVVSSGLRIAKSFHDWIRRQDLLFGSGH